jgi:hypothetical protein
MNNKMNNKTPGVDLLTPGVVLKRRAYITTTLVPTFTR